MKNDSYEGDGYVIVRHESTKKVEELITTIVETMKISLRELSAARAQSPNSYRGASSTSDSRRSSALVTIARTHRL